MVGLRGGAHEYSSVVLIVSQDWIYNPIAVRMKLVQSPSKAMIFLRCFENKTNTLVRYMRQHTKRPRSVEHLHEGCRMDRKEDCFKCLM